MGEIYYEIRKLFCFVLYCTKRRCSKIKPQLKVEIEEWLKAPYKPSFCLQQQLLSLSLSLQIIKQKFLYKSAIYFSFSFDHQMKIPVNIGNFQRFISLSLQIVRWKFHCKSAILFSFFPNSQTEITLKISNFFLLVLSSLDGDSFINQGFLSLSLQIFRNQRLFIFFQIIIDVDSLEISNFFFFLFRSLDGNSHLLIILNENGFKFKKFQRILSIIPFY